MYGRYLDRDGTPSGESFILGVADEKSRPSLAWDGDEFVVTWDISHFIQMASVGPRGVEHPIFPFSFGAQTSSDAVYANGAAFVAYQHIDPDATNSARIFTRTITSRMRVRPGPH